MSGCYRCGEPLLPPLDACLSCGAPVFGAGLEAAEWAVELGPVGSQRFRAEAVARLEAIGVEGLSPSRAVERLARERVRAVEGLERAAAEALAEHLGRRETNATVVRGVAPRRGARGALLGGLPLLAAALGVGLWVLWSPLGLALGLGAAAALGAMGARRRMPVLGVPPPSPLPPLGVEGLVGRLFEAAAPLREGERAAVLGVGRRALTLVANLAREGDMSAQIAGGVDGAIGRAALAAARAVVELAERAPASAALPEGDATRLRSLAEGVTAATAALESVRALGDGPEASTAEATLQAGARALLEQVAGVGR